MRRWDIVIAAAPGDYGKPRPWLVVQSDLVRVAGQSIVLCPITSDVDQRTLPIRPVISRLDGTGLRKPSQVMIDKITALAMRRIGKVIGELDRSERERVDFALRALLGVSEY